MKTVFGLHWIASLGLMLTALSSSLSHASETLIPAGAVWKYLDDGSDQGTLWKEAAFNDTAWRSGPAQLGYGDGDEATVVSYGPDPNNKYLTTYFRHHFAVGDANSITSLTARLIYDDGAVVYLNGAEVFRVNMPTGPIIVTTVAPTTSPDNAVFSAALSPALLVTGNNVLAVEMHQVNPFSTDVSFDFELVGNGQLSTELPVVNVTATDSQAAESGPLTVVYPGTFTFYRSGDLHAELTAFFVLSGSAQNGVDYIRLTNRVTFPSGAAQTRLDVYPLNDNLIESAETVVLTLESPVCAAMVPPPPGCYRVGASPAATVFIADAPSPPANRPPTARLVSPSDGAVFQGPIHITLIANGNDPDGYDTLQTIEFFDGAKSLGIRTNFPTLNPVGPFVLLWPNVPLGEYSLTAVATDDHGAKGTSAPVHISVRAEPPPNRPPSVFIVMPGDGGVYPAGANIPLGANAPDSDGFVQAVEFFANEASLGLADGPFDNAFAEWLLRWTNVQSGDYVFTAVATDNGGLTSTSAPVHITVRQEPPGDRELHVVGIYQGVGTGGNHERGHASVLADRPGKRVTLFLSAYEPVLWSVTPTDGTFIEKVILSGYYTQAISGVGAEVPLLHTNLFIGDSLDSGRFYQHLPKICAMTGLDISSFHGRDEAQSTQSFVIDSVQDDERLRCDYPQPTSLSELPALNFRLTFYEGATPGSGHLFFQDYTLGGPQNAAKLLPAMRVVTDGGQRYYYGSDGPGVRQATRVDSETGAAETVVFTPVEEDLGWEMGTAFDSMRQRILLVTLGGEGFLYALAQDETEWTRLASMNNLDVDCLEYHAPGDALYGVRISHADYGAASVYEFSPSGALRREIRLAVLPFDIAPARHRSELVSVGEYLVLLLEPEYSFSSEPHEARIYLIDPRTGQVWLTYRRVSPPDSDADGVADDRDRCPHTAPGATVDANGCSPDQRDADGDGIADSRDRCPNTSPGAIVNREGCSLAQLCPCDGPWANHAEYIRCVIQRAWEFCRQDLITPDQRQEIERDAVMSDCGRHESDSEPVCMHLLPLTAEECQRDGFQFILSGDAAGGCVIEGSTDLVHWAPVETRQEAIIGQEIVSPVSDNVTVRFYRVRLTP